MRVVMCLLVLALTGGSDSVADCGVPPGNSYYVAPTGHDTNDCSLANPCREIRQALTLVQPGDAIFVADGDYLGFTAAAINGTADLPILIAAQGTNAYVHATTDRADNRDNIFITFCQYLILDGLNSTNAPRAGLRIDQSPHITVRHGRFGSNDTWGIFTDFSDDTVLENNECYSSRTQHGIYISNSSDRPILRGNHCHDNAAVGIHMNGDLSQGGDGLITGALVENNLIHDNGALGGAGINLDGVQDSLIRNNVLFNNHATGIAMYDGDAAAGPKNNLVAHNTIDQASNGRWALLIWNSAGPNTIRNNILHNRHAFRGAINLLTAADVANTDSDFNAFGGNCTVTTNDDVIITLAQWQALGKDTHSICAGISNLVVAPFADYHLLTNAPAVDAGQTLTNVPTDIESLTRPAGAVSDIGAYESGGSLAPPQLFVTLVGDDVCLRFDSLPGKTYGIERTDDLPAGFGEVVAENLAGTGQPLFVTDTGAALLPRRFYRLQIQF